MFEIVDVEADVQGSQILRFPNPTLRTLGRTWSCSSSQALSGPADFFF